jgi:hypothetical protein
MVQMIPEKFSEDGNFSEKLIYRSFEGLESRNDWIVLHSLELSKIKAKAQTEVDFIVIVPKRGIVIVECKGATRVTIDGSDWELEGLPPATRKKSPIAQAEIAQREIRGMLKGMGYPVDAIPFSRIVWLPLIDQGKVAQSGNQVAIWEIALQSDLEEPDKAILRALDEELAARQGNSVVHYKPTTLSVPMAKELAAALRTKVELAATPEGSSALRQSEVVKATEEQLLTLEVVERNSLLYFEGEAGSGKTVMLTRCALDWAHDSRRVLYLCFNEMLRDSVQEQIGRHELITVMNFNDLMLKLAGLKKNPAKAGQEWFDVELPAKALEAVKAGKTSLQFEAICIDEFQDLVPREAIFWPIMALLSSKFREFKIALAGDDEQQIYTSGSRIDSFAWAKKQLPGLVRVSLHTNCRQSPKLTAAIHKLLNWQTETKRSRLSKGMDGTLEVIKTSESNQGKDLHKVLKRLMKNYKAENIRVLSPLNTQSVLGKLAKSTENHAADLRALKALTEYPQNGGVINWRSIPKYKGLEDDVVVITDVSPATADWLKARNQTLRNQLYVGLTRARFHAIVLVQDGQLTATHNVDGERV